MFSPSISRNVKMCRAKLRGTLPIITNLTRCDMDTESAEWVSIIKRRGVLIYNKNRDGLTEDEAAELAILDGIVTSVIEAKHKPVVWKRVNDVEEYVRRMKGGNK